MSNYKDLIGGSSFAQGTDGALLAALRNVASVSAQQIPGPPGPPGPPGATVGPEQYVFLGAATSYTLADGTTVGQRVGIKDNAGTAQTVHPVIHGNIDNGTLFLGFNQNGAAFEFVWSGTTWSVF